ncbi:MAG: NAD(P)-dependent oxidoreductase [Rhodospirillales bacterium]|nr:NAD(P)-dependent oxidoreductase [Rhodospirillales bacterium]
MLPYERVLVTGGSGRLGRAVVKELNAHCAVSTIDCAPAAFALPHGVVDILDLQALYKAIKGHDAVVHIAALDSHVKATPDEFFKTNAIGTWNVLHAAYEADVRKVVVCSSNAATGLNFSNKQRPPHYLPYDESHPLHPTNAYGLSKQINEITARSFADRGRMEVICLRPSYVAFPDIVRLMVARITEPERVNFPWMAVGEYLEPLQLLRSYIHPADAARCFRLALQATGIQYDVFFVSAADSFDSTPTLAHIERTYGRLPEIRKPWVYERNPYASVIDCSRARERLGWEPTTDWAALSGITRG